MYNAGASASHKELLQATSANDSASSPGLDYYESLPHIGALPPALTPGSQPDIENETSYLILQETERWISKLIPDIWPLIPALTGQPNFHSWLLMIFSWPRPAWTFWSMCLSVRHCSASNVLQELSMLLTVGIFHLCRDIKRHRILSFIECFHLKGKKEWQTEKLIRYHDVFRDSLRWRSCCSGTNYLLQKSSGPFNLPLLPITKEEIEDLVFAQALAPSLQAANNSVVQNVSSSAVANIIRNLTLESEPLIPTLSRHFFPIYAALNYSYVGTYHFQFHINMRGLMYKQHIEEKIIFVSNYSMYLKTVISRKTSSRDAFGKAQFCTSQM